MARIWISVHPFYSLSTLGVASSTPLPAISATSLSGSKHKTPIQIIYETHQLLLKSLPITDPYLKIAFDVRGGPVLGKPVRCAGYRLVIMLRTLIYVGIIYTS